VAGSESDDAGELEAGPRPRAPRRGDDDFETAVYDTQREYIDRQAETLIEGGFSAWANSN